MEVVYNKMTTIRKLFLDSRFGVGSAGDFTIELPLQVLTKKTEGLVLGAFSIANVFNSVIAGYNDRLYWRVSNNAVENMIHAGVNDRFYWGYDTGTSQSWVITTLPPGTYTAAQMATLLAVRINNVIPFLVATAGPPQYSSPVIQWNSTVASLYLPDYGDITDPAWQRQVWRGAAYDILDSRSVGCIGDSTQGWRKTWTTVIEEPSAFVDWNFCNTIAPGSYTGAQFAVQLQSTLNYATTFTSDTVTCTYVADEAVIRVQSTRDMQIFDPELLKSQRWLADEWFAPKYDRKGLTLVPSDLRSANGICWGPGSPDNDFLTHQLNLAPVREVYVHCSASDYGTLTSSGMRDVLAVIQIDESWGSVVTWRPFSLNDQDVIPLQDGVLGPSMRFYLTDAYGRVLPLGESYVYLQLSIIPLQTQDT